MSQRTHKRWIFTKSTEYQPHGILQVGQILSDPFEPSSALHPGGPLPLLSPSPTSSGDTGTVRDAAADVGNSTAGLGSAPPLAKNYQGYGMLKPEETFISGVQLSQNSELTSQFGLALAQIAKIRSTIITPSMMYVEESLRHGDIPSSITLKWWNRLRAKQLYMVSGVRVVEGARLVRSEKSESGGWEVEGRVSASAAAAAAGGAARPRAINQPQVPLVQVGGKLARDETNREEMSFQSATDFVFAYRLQEIFWYGTGGKVKHAFFQEGGEGVCG
ncbi:hypothetical protein V8F06_007307 [Rhypophila decipiens]